MNDNRELGVYDKVPRQNQNRTVELIVFGFTIGLISLLEMLGWLQGGGISSILSAAQHIQNKSQVVDVDSSSLRAPIMISLALIAWILTSALHLRMRSKWRGAVLALVIFGGGFVLDGLIEPPMTVKYMASRGYSRCPSRDHHVGNGKSRVWFDDYALSQEACSTGLSSAQER